MSDNQIDDDPVTIIGLAVETPGGVDTPDKYWDLLSDAREVLSPFPSIAAGRLPS